MTLCSFTDALAVLSAIQDRFAPRTIGIESFQCLLDHVVRQQPVTGVILVHVLTNDDLSRASDALGVPKGRLPDLHTTEFGDEYLSVRATVSGVDVTIYGPLSIAPREVA